MYFLYLLLLFDFSSSAEVLPRINIEWTSTSKTRYGKTYSSWGNAPTLTLGEHFDIEVNTKGVEIEYDMTCDVLHKRKIKFRLEPCHGKKNCYNKLGVKATSGMSTQWKCEFVIDNMVRQTGPFDVRVRLSYSGNLDINGNPQTSRPLQAIDFDNIVHYNYVEGEMAKIECKINKAIKTSMVYHDKDNQKIELPDKMMLSTLNLKLNKARNGTSLDCIVTGMDECYGYYCPVHNITRVYFLLGTPDHPTFKINDLVLKTNVASEAKDIVYKYDYYDGERVVLETLIDSSYKGVECTTYNDVIPEQIDGLVQTPVIIPKLSLPLTLDKTYNGFQLVCKLHNARSYSKVVKDGTKISNISLDFKHIEATGLKPSLSGFSRANVLAQFDYKLDKKNSEDWAWIQYSYREQELRLTCTANDHGITWAYNADQVDGKPLEDGWSNEVPGHLLKESFKLKPNCNRAVISCFKKYYGSTTIELIRGEPLFKDEPAVATNTGIKPPFLVPDKISDITTSFINNERNTNDNTNNFDHRNHIDTTTKTKLDDKIVDKVKVNEKSDGNGDTKSKDTSINFGNGKNKLKFNNFDFKEIVFENKNQDSYKKIPIEKIPEVNNPTDTDDTDTITHPDVNHGPIIESSTESDSVTDNLRKNDKEPETHWALIGIILGVIMIAVNVTLVAFCLYKLYKRGKLEQFQDEPGIVEYENLPEHNEGPMQMPKQWDTHEITYATPHQNNTEMLYTKPISKDQRKTENVYTNLNHSKLEPTYANAGKTVAKKDSIVNENNKKDNNIAYANLSTLTNVDTYAQVLPKSQRKSEVEYKNICKNDDNDYLESAYAEIAKK